MGRRIWHKDYLQLSLCIQMPLLFLIHQNIHTKEYSTPSDSLPFLTFHIVDVSSKWTTFTLTYLESQKGATSLALLLPLFLHVLDPISASHRHHAFPPQGLVLLTLFPLLSMWYFVYLMIIETHTQASFDRRWLLKS